MSVPAFPSPAVVERAMDLGFGSGPWDRAELAERWGEPTANRFIDDAKKAGWLLSPFRNVFFVPQARDLMVMGWLPPSLREEFVINSVLQASGMRSWCFSAWAREEGIIFPEPLFVTDLAPPSTQIPTPSRRWAPSAEARRSGTALARAERWGRVPFLDNIVIVPELPQASSFPRQAFAVLPVGEPKRTGAPWSSDDELPSAAQALPLEQKARAIPYRLTAEVDDSAWIAALVAALSLPRLDERLEAVVERLLQADASVPKRVAAERRKKGREGFVDRWQGWLGTMGEAEPNQNWKQRLQQRAPSYLLVPPWLWDEVKAARMSRRFVAVEVWRRVLGARP